jgi:hypothetical protein
VYIFPLLGEESLLRLIAVDARLRANAGTASSFNVTLVGDCDWCLLLTPLLDEGVFLLLENPTTLSTFGEFSFSLGGERWETRELMFFCLLMSCGHTKMKILLSFRPLAWTCCLAVGVRNKEFSFNTPT